MNKSKKILVSAFSVMLISGAAFLTFLFMRGFFDVNINPSYKEGQIKVACVGDSVTHGHNLKNQPKNNYPKILGTLMGEGYNVCNFGISGSTVQDSGDQPYRATKAYAESVEYGCDILVLMIGSNDSKPENWKGEETFKKAYLDLLDDYIKDNSNPTVFLCTPPTAYYPEGVTEGITNYDIDPVIVEKIADIVRSVAEEKSYELIDMNDLTENRRDLFQGDNVHPNNDGARFIAESVYEKIK